MNRFTQTSASVSIDATTTTDNADLGAANNASSCDVLISNIGDVWVYVAFGDSSVEAAAAGVPIPPNGQRILQKPSQATFIAAITATGTATVVATPGQGD